MSIEKAIEVCGGTAKLARLLGHTTQVVDNWRRRGSVPVERCPAIERATGGQVRCEDLRPDIDWAVLRCRCAEEGHDERRSTDHEMQEAA